MSQMVRSSQYRANVKLASKIEEYWKKRGFSVTVLVSPDTAEIVSNVPKVCHQRGSWKFSRPQAYFVHGAGLSNVTSRL